MDNKNKKAAEATPNPGTAQGAAAQGEASAPHLIGELFHAINMKSFFAWDLHCNNDVLNSYLDKLFGTYAT